MADEELKARLESHSKAFEGLMALIPAKYYYGEDNDDQWQRKKQTKEQKRQAKKAKLEPGAYKSALDVHLERENGLKRKRQSEHVGEGEDNLAMERPGEGLKTSMRNSKKQKHNLDSAESTGSNPSVTVDDTVKRQEKAEKRKEKRERKKAKAEKRKAKLERKKAKANETVPDIEDNDVADDRPEQDTSTQTQHKAFGSKKLPKQEQEPRKGPPRTNLEIRPAKDDKHSEEAEAAMDQMEMADFVDDEDAHSKISNSSASSHNSQTFDTSGQHSVASSTSSVLPPSKATEKPQLQPLKEQESEVESAQEADELASPRTRMKILNMPQIDPEVLRERLASKLATLRAARNADGPDGKPARNRQELIEARRRKEERRKAHKKELRAQAKEERTAEAEAARLRGGSGSPMWSPGAFPAKSPTNNFSFGRIEFDDGAHMDSSGSHILESRKTKGPSDPRTALEALSRKQARINGFDEDKRVDIEEKDRWLNAKKRIYGEKLRDDMNLLKKTLKRKEEGKSKSEKEWSERFEGVEKGKEMRQKKREDNLAKRREEKGSARSKGRFGIKFNPGGQEAKKGPAKKRPGFEGTFKTPARRNH